jgi:spore germination cell wall hydrolase CwlJ-like protein
MERLRSLLVEVSVVIGVILILMMLGLVKVNASDHLSSAQVIKIMEGKLVINPDEKRDDVILTEQAQLIFQTTTADWLLEYANLNLQDVKCLAQNIYFEARTESMLGKTAVAWVVMNRVNSKQFPKTICDVVFQGPHRESWKTRQVKDLKDSERKYYPRRDRCQFSWYCDGKKDIIWANYQDGRTIFNNSRAWFDSIVIAMAVMSNMLNDNTDGSLYYYNHHLVFPNWATTQELKVIIGNHTFMK